MDLWLEKLLLLRLRLLLLHIRVVSRRLRLECLRHLLLLTIGIEACLLLAEPVQAVRVSGRLCLVARECVVHVARGLDLHLSLVDRVREEIDRTPLLVALVEARVLRLRRLRRFVIE